MARAVVFAYSSVGCECLKVLLDSGVNVVRVYTHEDDPNEEHWFDSVYDLAHERGLQVVTPENLTGELEHIKALAPDVIFSFYYRSLIPQEILDLAPLGAFNMHGSLLPRYRGRACVNWAVLNGETETGVTLHRMTARADRGNIVDQQAVSIDPDETAFDVFKKLIPAAGVVMRRTLENILAGRAEGVVQDESQATLFGRRRPADGLLDWTKTTHELHNLVRAVAWPFPGAFTFLNGRKLMVWRTRPYENADKNMTTKAGTVVSSEPLRVMTSAGTLEILEAQWVDERGERKNINPDCPCPKVVAGSVFNNN